MCGGGCVLDSGTTFSALPAHNYVKIQVKIALVDYWAGYYVYLYADGALRSKVYKNNVSIGLA